MRLARPSTLWRALLQELWRLVALSASITVVVGIFAITLRPLADGRIGPEEALKFMAFAALPMLQYALPFAAGFGATLAYHRLSAENELVACHAGGISHRSILVPAGITGLVLAGFMLLLTDTFIPRLLRGMDELLSPDVVRLMIAPIKRGESIQFGKPGQRYQVFADDVASPEGDAGGAAERYILSGVLIVQVDDQGKVLWEASARTAYMWIFRGVLGNTGGTGSTVSGRGETPGTTVVLRLVEASGSKPGEGYVEAENNNLTYQLPDLFADDPKFHSWVELQEMKSRPQMINVIDRKRRALGTMMSERSVTEAISARLARTGTVKFTDASGREVTLRGMRLGSFSEERGYQIEPARGARVEVVTVLGEGRARVQRAARAWLSLATDPGTATQTTTIRLEQVSTGNVSVAIGSGGSGGTGDQPSTIVEPGGELKEWNSTGLVLVDSPAAANPPEDVRALVRDARTMAKDSPAGARLEKAAEDLEKWVEDLLREILSKQQERLAAAAACMVMVVCGAVMALRLRESQPLTTYLWSFLPGLGTLLTISGGQRLTHQYGMPGLLLLWGGVAGLALYTLVEYWQLRRR